MAAENSTKFYLHIFIVIGGGHTNLSIAYMEPRKK